MKIRIIKESRVPVQQSQVHKDLMDWWDRYRKSEIKIIGHNSGHKHKTQRKRINYYKEIDFEFLQKLPKDIDIDKLLKKMKEYQKLDHKSLKKDIVEDVLTAVENGFQT